MKRLGVILCPFPAKSAEWTIRGSRPPGGNRRSLLWCLPPSPPLQRLISPSPYTTRGLSYKYNRRPRRRSLSVLHIAWKWLSQMKKQVAGLKLLNVLPGPREKNADTWWTQLTYFSVSTDTNFCRYWKFRGCWYVCVCECCYTERSVFQLGSPSYPCTPRVQQLPLTDVHFLSWATQMETFFFFPPVCRTLGSTETSLLRDCWMNCFCNISNY